MKRNIKIGKFINRALALRNVSQKEIAAVTGVAPNIISYFCHDVRTPNARQIIKIAEYLDVSTDYLLGRSEKPTADNGWITAAKKQPENDDYYLVIFQEWDIFEKNFSKPMLDVLEYVSKYKVWNTKADIRVLYWQPLPKMPTELTENERKK